MLYIIHHMLKKPASCSFRREAETKSSGLCGNASHVPSICKPAKRLQMEKEEQQND